MPKSIYKIIGIPLFIFLIGFGCDTLRTMPNQALVFVDKGEYFAPPYFMAQNFYTSEDLYVYAGWKNIEIKRYEEVKKVYMPNKDCADSEFFIEEGRSLSGLLLEKLGVLPPFKSRWNNDGSWNY